MNYIRTLNIDEPLTRIKGTTVRHYVTDALGSVIGLADDTGVMKTTYTYDPFGNTTVSGEASDNPFQYTGRENDGTGLYYYRARYYSPDLQRFISEDPIGLKGGDVNFYAYVGNNPVNWVDPLGLFGMTGPGLLNVLPEGSPCRPKNPYDDCLEKARKFRKTCLNLLWLAQAKCTAICAVACIGSAAGYPACLASCAYACHRGFAMGRAGCWATYAAMLEACRRSNDMMDKQRIYLQALTAVVIVTLCIFISLYILEFIKVPVLDSIILKSIVTSIVCIGFIGYIFLLYKNRVRRLHLIGFSFMFEAIGYWWLYNWVGYIFIALGFILLIISFSQRWSDH